MQGMMQIDFDALQGTATVDREGNIVSITIAGCKVDTSRSKSWVRSGNDLANAIALELEQIHADEIASWLRTRHADGKADYERDTAA